MRINNICARFTVKQGESELCRCARQLISSPVNSLTEELVDLS